MTQAAPVKHFDEEAFMANINAGMSMEDIMLSCRERAAKSTRRISLARKPVVLHVTVTKNVGFFGAETFSDTIEVTVDSKIRTLDFHGDEDHIRPPYVGTFSKKSTVITGRRPFAKDADMFNYDYDSEADWEEEEPGEDIADSDGEEDADDNELEYNEFFLRDNDYGSDAGSDGEEFAISSIRRRDVVEVEKIGPRFLRQLAPHANASNAAFQFGKTGFLEACSEKEKDVQRLRSYNAVVFAKTLPLLGVNSAAINGGISSSSVSSGEGEASAMKAKKAAKEPIAKCFDDAHLAELITFIHGKKDGVDKLVNAFQAEHPKLAKTHVKKRIGEIAEKERHADGHGTQRWIVKKEFVAKAQMSDLKQVEFTPVKKVKSKVGGAAKAKSSSGTGRASKRLTAPSSANPAETGEGDDGEANAGDEMGEEEVEIVAGPSSANGSTPSRSPLQSTETVELAVAAANTSSSKKKKAGLDLFSPQAKRGKSTSASSSSSSSAVKPISSFFKGSEKAEAADEVKGMDVNDAPEQEEDDAEAMTSPTGELFPSDA